MRFFEKLVVAYFFWATMYNISQLKQQPELDDKITSYPNSRQ